MDLLAQSQAAHYSTAQSIFFEFWTDNDHCRGQNQQLTGYKPETKKIENHYLTTT
ncbi:hypothetical protein AB4454_10495 [Vibrio artabrorum]|uniref:hypothetical protein n=1 Tax=Vibrio artabrorum TaxID=446374 RepID=UPI003552F9AE